MTTTTKTIKTAHVCDCFAETSIRSERDEKEHGVIHERDVIDEIDNRLVEILESRVEERKHDRARRGHHQEQEANNNERDREAKSLRRGTPIMLGASFGRESFAKIDN